MTLEQVLYTMAQIDLIFNPHLRLCFCRDGEVNVREKPQLTASCTCLNRGSNPNLGMCPTRESNPQPLSVQDHALTN